MIGAREVCAAAGWDGQLVSRDISQSDLDSGSVNISDIEIGLQDIMFISYENGVRNCDIK